jgi:hypothetical protein
MTNTTDEETCAGKEIKITAKYDHGTTIGSEQLNVV